MIKKSKVYPAHLCITCRQMTTNKHYCDTCRGFFMKPPYYSASPPRITADIGKTTGRRHEDTKKLRG